jgi:hypothetical protein
VPLQVSRSITPEVILRARQKLARAKVADFACLVDIPTVPLSDEEDEDKFSVMRLDTLVAHHSLLLGALQRLEEGSIPNLMVLMPPGSAKSTYVDVVFVPWFMARRGRRNVILASYAADIAKKQGRRARQLLKSKAFANIMPGIALKDDQHAADEWALTNGSEYMSGGLLSGITGNRSHLGIVDDPIKGRAAAESEVIREKVWETYVDDFCSRLIPGAPQVMILTRWHEDDPAGRILPDNWDGESGLFSKCKDGRDWYVICLPAIADRSDDPLGREIGQTLWPEWFAKNGDNGVTHWAPFMQSRRTWTSLYQQKPTAAEGTFFQRSWFKRYRPDERPSNLHIYLTSDHAPAGEGNSDYNCCRVWGVDHMGDIWLLDGFRIQQKMDKFVERIVGRPLREGKEGLISKWKPFAWFPEDDNNWKAVEPFVRAWMREEEVHTVIAPMSPHGQDKPTKAQAFQSYAEMGRVRIPVGPEGDEIIDEYAKFPGGKHDDEVDNGSVIGRALDKAHPAIAPRPKAADPKFPVQRNLTEIIAARTRKRREAEGS